MNTRFIIRNIDTIILALSLRSFVDVIDNQYVNNNRLVCDGIVGGGIKTVTNGCVGLLVLHF